MTGFKHSFKIYWNLWLPISEIFRDFYYNIWRIKFVFPSSSHVLKLYMHYTFIYRTSYFDLIVGSSSVKYYNKIVLSMCYSIFRIGFFHISRNNRFCNWLYVSHSHVLYARVFNNTITLLTRRAELSGFLQRMQ